MSSTLSLSLSPMISQSRGILAQPVKAGQSDSKQIETDFLKEAQKSPAERMHEALLKRLGITEEQFQSMDADQKSAIADAIKDQIKQDMQSKKTDGTGYYTDMTA